MNPEQRIQWAAEQILGDESLTDALDDAPAKRLLDWGVAASKRLCEQTAGMDEAGAQAWLEGALPNLRQVIRRVNKLAGSLLYTEAEMLAGSAAGIIEAARAVPGLLASEPPDPESLAAGLAGQPPAAAVDRILSLFN